MFKVREFECADLGSLVACYQMVFRGEPWNEEWEAEQVRSLINDPRRHWWVAVDVNNNVVGFAAGGVAKTHEWADELGADLRGIPEVEVGYQADIGVLVQYRESGVARALAKVRLEWFRNNGAQWIMLRSKPGAVTFGWFQRKGYEVCYSYPDGRVILAHSASNIQL